MEWYEFSISISTVLQSSSGRSGGGALNKSRQRCDGGWRWKKFPTRSYHGILSGSKAKFNKSFLWAHALPFSCELTRRSLTWARFPRKSKNRLIFGIFFMDFRNARFAAGGWLEREEGFIWEIIAPLGGEKLF